MTATDRPVGWIREIVINSRDPVALAGFWSRVVGGTPTEWYDGWVTLEPPPHGQRLSFQRSADRAGDDTHVDVLVADLEAAHVEVLSAGASYVEERWSPRPGPDGERVPWRVYRDPEGHAFCLVIR
jgi:Glyoxalase-like domain